MPRKTACAVHEAALARSVKRVEELEAALLKITQDRGKLTERLAVQQGSANAMRAMLMRERYEATLVKQERDALRKVVIVLAEAGSFPEPNQPIIAAYDEGAKKWNLDSAGTAFGVQTAPTASF